MISTRSQPYRLTNDNFDRCLQIITRSGAADLIEHYHHKRRGNGGRPRSGRRYTILGVLVVGLAIICVGRPASMAEIHRVLGTLSDEQFAAIGMDPAGGDESNRGTQSDYPAFQAWLTRMLVPLDSGADLPARRVTNRDHRRHLASRTDERWKDSKLARERLHEVVNRIVAASVRESNPAGYRGDIAADETIIDLAGQSQGLGSRDDKQRAAAYSGAYYARDRADNNVLGNPARAKQLAKTASGLGATVVLRLGRSNDLYGVSPVATALAFAPPSSGSPESLAIAIGYHKANGFDPREDGRCRTPFLTTDMGYNVKAAFNSMALEEGYAPVVRYPRHWNTAFASEGPGHTRGGQADGPVQISGDFYCPAARQIIGKQKMVRKTVDILGEGDGFEVQDRLLEAMFPLLMGTNSTPYRARAGRGRPRKDDAADPAALPVKQDLVCPAVQGRVQCPLKPASMGAADLGVPTVQPTWTAERYRCCSQSQVTVTLSKDQWRMAQWGLVPGSWEHALYFEAARAATEQRFSIMKSQHVTGIEHMKWSPRREPMLCLLIGLWVAATNVAIQDVYDRRPPRPSSIKKRMKQLEADLGRPPTRIPPRT